MTSISAITFVPVDGEATVPLEVLPARDQVLKRVEDTLRPYSLPDAPVDVAEADDVVTDPAVGFHVIYVYGHAWFDDDQLFVCSRTRDGQSITEPAGSLVDRILSTVDQERAIVIFDCCHAEAFDAYVRSRWPLTRLVVYGSGRDEKAIALMAEKSSRLALGLSRKLGRRFQGGDLVAIISSLSSELDRDTTLPGQHISYRMNGAAVRLEAPRYKVVAGREVTVNLIRNALLGMGGALAALLIATIWFYWAHVLVEVRLSGLSSIADQITVTATEETPAENGSKTFANIHANSDGVTFWAPASNVIIRVQAHYHDGADRALNFHRILTRGFAMSDKSVEMTLPAAAVVEAHPNMAFVPTTKWIHGRDRVTATNGRSFWIDLRPPSVDEYRPVAIQLLQSGKLQPENSYLLVAEERSRALDAVGGTPIRVLAGNLGDIFGVVSQASSNFVSTSSDIVVGVGTLPCVRCPAIMTHLEAEIYCHSQNKRLPTDLEWELAVRGVDGRDYPWGNRFDPTRANVPGLPNKGDPPPELKPVDAYPAEKSPYGLTDTVGNAGDWVANASGSLENVYMGATYRFNPEDATAFRMLPVTDSYLVRETTARCAV